MIKINNLKNKIKLKKKEAKIHSTHSTYVLYIYIHIKGDNILYKFKITINLIYDNNKTVFKGFAK